jgi:hypothetical protein
MMLHAHDCAGDGVASPIPLRALSLGDGVQSTTMALMAAHDIVQRMEPKPSNAIVV